MTKVNSYAGRSGKEIICGSHFALEAVLVFLALRTEKVAYILAPNASPSIQPPSRNCVQEQTATRRGSTQFDSKQARTTRTELTAKERNWNINRPELCPHVEGVSEAL
jgi:hypothetical protein